VLDIKRPRTRIAVRVAGSWVAAIGMLMFGWLIRGQGRNVFNKSFTVGIILKTNRRMSNRECRILKCLLLLLRFEISCSIFDILL
jgi:hypothetical protein